MYKHRDQEVWQCGHKAELDTLPWVPVSPTGHTAQSQTALALLFLPLPQEFRQRLKRDRIISVAVDEAARSVQYFLAP